MKKTNKAVLSAAVVVFLGVVSLPAAEQRPATIQYGQGVAVTFFKPATPKTTVAFYKDGRVVGEAPKPGEGQVRWLQQSLPNGSAVSYSVRE